MHLEAGGYRGRPEQPTCGAHQEPDTHPGEELPGQREPEDQAERHPHRPPVRGAQLPPQHLQLPAQWHHSAAGHPQGAGGRPRPGGSETGFARRVERSRGTADLARSADWTAGRFGKGGSAC